jgi:hypothetical protein
MEQNICGAQACQRALLFEVLDVYGVERILQQGLEHDSTGKPVTGQQASLDLKLCNAPEKSSSDVFFSSLSSTF